MQNKINSRNCAIDIFKYISALLVIGIHTALFSDVHNGLYFITVHIICRFAVPFFAVCSGYFFANSSRSVLEQWKKMLAIYLIWTFVYLVYSIPRWKEMNWFGLGSFVDYGVATVSKGAYYHLWYLLSVLYALPLLGVILRKANYKYYIWIAAGFYSIKVVSYGYRLWLPIQVVEIIEMLDRVSAIFDAVFCILPFLLMGAYIYRNPKSNKKIELKGTIISVAMLVAEASLLAKEGQNAVSYIIFTFPVAYFAFRLIVNWNIKMKCFDSKMLGDISLGVYCIHPIIIEALRKVIENSVVVFGLTSLLATLIAIIILLIKKKIIKAIPRRNKYV